MIQMGIKSVPLNEFAPHNFVSDRDAIVSEEITIDPGEIASLAIANTDENYEGITVLWSDDEMICDPVMDKSENMTKIQALNTGSSSITYEKGQKIGSFVKIGDTVVDSNELEERHSLEERQVNMVLAEKHDEKKRIGRLIEVLEDNREKEKLPSDIREIVKRHEHAFALSDSELGMAKGIQAATSSDGRPNREVKGRITASSSGWRHDFRHPIQSRARGQRSSHTTSAVPAANLRGHRSGERKIHATCGGGEL